MLLEMELEDALAAEASARRLIRLLLEEYEGAVMRLPEALSWPLARKVVVGTPRSSSSSPASPLSSPRLIKKEPVSPTLPPPRPPTPPDDVDMWRSDQGWDDVEWPEDGPEAEPEAVPPQ